MKKKLYLSSRIYLINKKFKQNEFYHYFEEPNNVIIIPKIKDTYIIVEQKREPINKKNFEKFCPEKKNIDKILRKC